MTPHRKKCPHLVHFIVPRDWFEINSRHQKCYSEDGKKCRGCRGLLGRVIVLFSLEPDSWENKTNCFPRDHTLSVYLEFQCESECWHQSLKEILTIHVI